MHSDTIYHIVEVYAIFLLPQPLWNNMKGSGIEIKNYLDSLTVKTIVKSSLYFFVDLTVNCSYEV